MAGEKADEEAHRERGGDGGDEQADHDGRGAEGGENLGTVLVGLQRGGGREQGQPDEKTELGGEHRGQAGEVAADDGHHGAAGAGPQREALHAADEQRLAGAEVLQRGPGGVARERGVNGQVFAPRLDPEHEQGARYEREDDGVEGEQIFVDQIAAEQAEHSGGDAGDDDVDREAQAVGIAADEAGKNGDSRSDAAKASASRPAGERTTVIASQHAAAPDSPTIISRRRSNRSAIAPASGPKNPITANVRSIVAATHAEDRV